MHEKQSVRAPRNIFQERTRERKKKEYVCAFLCTCVSERTDEREGEKDNERCSGSSVFKKKSQKSNKLTILLSSVDALIKEK